MPVKAERVRAYLGTTDYTASEIAAIVKCSYQLVTAERRKLRCRTERDTVQRRLAMLEQEVREHRTAIRKLTASSTIEPAGMARQ